MKWTKQLKSVTIISMLALSLAACNTEVGNVSPQEIIENVVKENKEPFAYYAESKTVLSDDSSLMMKEWKDEDGKVRTEIVDSLGHTSHSVNDGSVTWMHDLEANEVMQFSLEESDSQSVNKSPSEQAKVMLETIENTHTIKVVGNETFIGRPVIHVKATPKSQEENLFSEQELWIDKETWFVLKSISTFDGNSTVTEYTKFEMNPKFESDLFVFDMPESAKIVELGNVNEPVVLHDIEEAAKYIEKPFYYVQDQQDILLHDISVFSMGGISSSLTLNYLKEEKPYFSLVITAVDEPNIKYNGSEGINLRGQQATVIESGNFRSISWVEDGIGYALLVDSPEAKTEEVVELFNAVNY